MKLTSIKIQNKDAFHLVLLFMTLMMLVIGKDMMHSTIRSYSFYLSESLLFGIFWVMFVPLILINTVVLKAKHRIVSSLTMSLFHISLFSLFVYGISTLFFDHAFSLSGIFTNTITENGIACLIVYGVVSIFLSQRKKVEKPKGLDKISVVYRNRTTLLNQEDIIYVKSEKPYISLVTSEKRYLHSSTLKKILAEKLTMKFIQIHKGILINTDHIVSFNSRKNGDYDIELSNQDVVRASRNFKNNFKSYFV